MYKASLIFVFLLSTTAFALECKNGPGFYRNPEDCTLFYRCVQGVRQDLDIFEFVCPGGLVFDEATSVCNWPGSSAPCDAPEEPEYEEGPSVEEENQEDTDLVIVQPTFDFQCTAPGFFAHGSDCTKFWLCKQDEFINRLEPNLFKCPAGYLFNDSVRRCLKEAEVVCDKTPDEELIRLEPEAIQLRESELEAFFSRFAYPYGGR